MLSLENRVHSKLLAAVQTLVTDEDVWAITIPLTKQKAGASMPACAGTECCSLGTGREMLSGVATETIECSPSSFDFAWTESSARHWELVSPAPGRTVFEAFLQSIFCSHSPPFPSPPLSTGTSTHGLFPSSFLSAQTLHTKVTLHPSLPSRFPLTEMLCGSFSVCLNVLGRAIPWKQRYFTEVPFTAEEALISTCFYKSRGSWKGCAICTDLERTTLEFTVIFFSPGNSHDSEGNCHTGESSTRWIIATFANAALTLLSSSLPLWYPQQENCSGTHSILEKSPFWLKNSFRINFYCSLIPTHLKAALFAHKHYAC